jgi:hypothetical protein
LLLAVAPATADILYDNGPYNGTTDAWQINFGFSVSDLFALSPYQCYYFCFVQGFNIVTWNIPNDNLNSLEMQLGSTSFGNDYSDQVLSPSGAADLGANQYGYELWRYDFSFGPVFVGGVGYDNWITLLNATVTNGDPIYWDENSGIGCQSFGCPSLAYENTLGSIPSEAFTATGVVYYDAAPEPSSVLLFGSGVLMLAGILRRKLHF